MGLGLALLGVVLFRWWAGLWIIGLGIFTYAVLALAQDAWVVFGLVFGLAALIAVVLALRGRRPGAGSAQPVATG